MFFTTGCRVRRFTCNVARTALFSADEITASVPQHGSRRRPRTASTRGCGLPTSMRFSPWSPAGLGWMYGGRHRGSRFAVCFFPALRGSQKDRVAGYREHVYALEAAAYSRPATEPGH
jgi:hypothetical protein